MEQNNKIKMAETPSTSTSAVKPLDVTILVKTEDVTTNVTVQLWKDCIFQYQYEFLMLPNVPLETYVQTTFGMYNALCKDKTENS